MTEKLEKAKKNKKIFRIIMIVSAIAALVSIFLFFPDSDVTKDAVEIGQVKEENDHAYIDVKAIENNAVAKWEKCDFLGLYKVLGANGRTYIVNMHDEKYDQFKNSEELNNGKTLRIYGDAVKVDETMPGNLGYQEEYYLSINIAMTSFTRFQIAIMILVVSLIALGYCTYKFMEAKTEINQYEEAIANNRDKINSEYLLLNASKGKALLIGLVGAVVGALLLLGAKVVTDSVAWFLAAAIPIGFYFGYTSTYPKITKAAKILSFIIAVVFTVVTMYLVYSWAYYKMLANTPMHISFWQSMKTWFHATRFLDNSYSDTLNGVTLMFGMSLAASVISNYFVVIRIGGGDKNE